MNFKPLLTIALGLAHAAAFGIVIRHDRDDAQYRHLAERYKSPVCWLAVGGHGTLISSRWVVTAAHVADGMSPFTGVATFGDQNVRVKSVYLHPSWGKSGRQTDLALIELETPVRGVKPARLYVKDDEDGKRIVFVGTGYTGTGLAEPKGTDRAWRAAHNTITRVDPATLFFKFDAPPEGDELEGISGPGDSGGPALLEEKGELYVLGVSSSNSAPRGQGHCTYGSIETYGRVSSNMAWLQETMKRRTGAVPFGKVKSLKAGWPQGPVVEAAQDYIRAFNTGNPDAILEHAQRHWDAEQISAATPAARRERTAQRMATFGTLEPRGVLQGPEGQLQVLLYSDRSKRYTVLSLLPSGPSKVTRVSFSDIPAGIAPVVK